jgi:hypothetical protein
MFMWRIAHNFLELRNNLGRRGVKGVVGGGAGAGSRNLVVLVE